MQHIPATMEEQLILKSIKEECPWENLPKRLQATLSSKEEWHRRIIDHCIKKRLHWNACFARKVSKEGEYYEEMMRYLRKNLALFPYHLAEYVSRVMRISPFRYYCDMIFEVMRNEQPYDSIPNFSAADALLITGIGRNEFIDIMNKCRSKKIMWKLNKSIAKELLPTQPVDFAIEPWWGVCLVNFTLEEFKKLTEEEMSTIDKVCKEEANSFVLFDPEIVRGLYKRGLIYFDVPVYPDDRFKVSRLEGFVSNREQSYEDPIEELLYAVFVVSSENSTVAELASTLQADLSQLQAAASFACRLGWAVKMIDPASVLRDSNASSAAALMLSDEEDNSSSGTSSTNTFPAGGTPGLENNLPHSGSSRLAFIVDANITSYLMMGSISPGLKSHAVTLYEAGKLGDASIADLCKDLATLEGKKFEGELQEFANHAYSLRCVLECLQSGGASSGGEKNLDKVGMQVPTDIGISGPAENLGVGENFDAQNSEEKLNEDNLLDHVESTDENDDSISVVSSDSIYTDANTASELVVSLGKVTEETVDLQGEKGDTVSSLGTPLNGKSTVKKRKMYLVNILRCESLAALSPATLNRLFRRDYDVVLSMVPLPSSSVLPGPTGPVHFGPPSYAAMTPWMKLALYTTVCNGPLSVVLMKGQCLRILPAPLAGCEKALLWSWDGSVTGGLGGKFEGNLVNGNILLHCLNSMLRSSAVLVQPLCKDDLNDSGKVVTIDIPLPLKNFDGSVVKIGESFGLCPEENIKLNSLLRELSERMELSTIGYIRLLRLLKETETDCIHMDDDKYQWVPLSVEFGIPLFSPKLCSLICERVISSCLLQADSLEGHHNEMQNLRKRLRDICFEYQVTGFTAKRFYYRENPKESPRQLMNYASGRWSPFSEPSTPISATSNELRRLKFANRQQFRTEVLSFDGNILRSYALTPVYEAATRTIEESSTTSSVKPESDDADGKEVILPGVNLLFDGSFLHPFDIGACLQGRQPILLIAEASAASAALQSNKAFDG